MLIPISEKISFVEAPNRARFPYCNCLLIDDDIKVIIDSSCGKENLILLEQYQIDIIINSHFHEDHILNNNYFAGAKVWAHGLDVPAICSMEVFKGFYGFKNNAEELGNSFIKSINLQASPIHREISDKEILDFGQVKMQVVHTPGHTPGHCSFFEEKSGLLFSGDIDLSGFGPWYGHSCSDLDDFISSIEKCQTINPRIIISSHKGIIRDDIPQRLQKYKDIIYKKEELLLSTLSRASSLEELTEYKIFYGQRVKFDPLTRLFERMAIEKHLERLLRLKEIKQGEGLFYLG